MGVAIASRHRNCVIAGGQIEQDGKVVIKTRPGVKRIARIAIDGHARDARGIAKTLDVLVLGFHDRERRGRRAAVFEKEFVVLAVVVLNNERFGDKIVADRINFCPPVDFQDVMFARRKAVGEADIGVFASVTCGVRAYQCEIILGKLKVLP